MTDTAPNFEPTADLPEALPPTNNVVLQAARAVSVTDQAAVAADVARSRIAGDVITAARQRHEITIGRCNDTLTQIEAAMKTIRDMAAMRQAEVTRQMEDDLRLEMDRARAVDSEKRAAMAAIAVLDAAA